MLVEQKVEGVSVEQTNEGVSPIPLRSVEAKSFVRQSKLTRLSIVQAEIINIEFFTVLITSYLASVVWHGLTTAAWRSPDQYISASICLAALVSCIALGFQHFGKIQTKPRHALLWSGVGAVGLAFSFFLSAIFLFKFAEDYSRGTLIFQFVSVGIAVAAERAAVYRWLQKLIAQGRVEAQRVVLIGDEEHCAQVRTYLEASGIQTAASFSLPQWGAVRNACPKLEVRRIIEACRRIQPDNIIALASGGDLPKVIELSGTLSELPVGIHIVPVDALEILSASQVVPFGNVATIQIYRAPLSFFDLVLKRVFDIVSAIAGLIALSPLFVVVAIAIKLDSRGPVLFRQTRHGFNNEPIEVFKFRSMTCSGNDGPFAQAVRNDSRITRMGRILRRSNIDELPQLINVLIGNMSMVGPRPHAVAHNDLFRDQIAPFSRRHNVKPGITGWAQVNGFRGETDTIEKMQRRVEFDLYYIDNWSFLLDMKIIFMTLFSKRAYINAY